MDKWNSKARAKMHKLLHAKKVAYVTAEEMEAFRRELSKSLGSQIKNKGKDYFGALKGIGPLTKDDKF